METRVTTSINLRNGYQMRSKQMKKHIKTLAATVLLTFGMSVGASAALEAQYTSLGVPTGVNTSFKTWMSYKKVTNRSSDQYKVIQAYGWSDENGFMRASGERDLGINDDYYLIALGSYYGTTMGTKYRITTDTGNVFYGMLADAKADRHTNRTNQYASHKDVVEFLVDTRYLRKDVKRAGSANVYMPLNGRIAKIERIDFVHVPEPEQESVIKMDTTLTRNIDSFERRAVSIQLKIGGDYIGNLEKISAGIPRTRTEM